MFTSTLHYHYVPMCTTDHTLCSGLPNGGSRSLASREEVDSSGGFSDRAGLLEESLAPGHKVGGPHGHHHHGGIIRHHPADSVNNGLQAISEIRLANHIQAISGTC